VDPANPSTWPIFRVLVPTTAAEAAEEAAVGEGAAVGLGALGIVGIAIVGGVVLYVIFDPPIKLDSGTLLIPNNVPFRSKSPEEAGRGDTGAIVLSLPPHTAPGGNGKPPSTGRPPTAPGAPCSFTPATQVSTDHGKEDIGKLHIGDKVLAYNPKTHQMELEPILHVWKHTDHDLIDVTIATTAKGQHGEPATKTSEVIHTNQKHPFFTIEHGFLPVGQIKLGMHLLRADGRVGVVTGWKVVPGTRVMYNLEVAQDHTFTVGAGQWVVHNDCPVSSTSGGTSGGFQKEEIIDPPLDKPPYPNPQIAFDIAMENLGRPLSEDAQLTIAKFGDAQGLANGMGEGNSFRWRLEWDATKGPHFNWEDWTAGVKGTGGRWGAVRFAGDVDLVNEMILKFNYGGITAMLE